MDGEWQGWYYTGQKFYLRTYKNGQKDGNWIWWFNDGKKKYEGSYLNDKKEGKWTEWNKEGDLVTSGTYHNSVKWSGIFDDGRYYKGRMANQSEQYYDNGTMKSQGMLIGEIKLDLWTYWYYNGNKK